VLSVPRDGGELEALVGMQQLQLTFVYSRVLGKKTRVRTSACPSTQAILFIVTDIEPPVIVFRRLHGAPPGLPASGVNPATFPVTRGLRGRRLTAGFSA
jgi:hypothetical protein